MKRERTNVLRDIANVTEQRDSMNEKYINARSWSDENNIDSDAASYRMTRDSLQSELDRLQAELDILEEDTEEEDTEEDHGNVIVSHTDIVVRGKRIERFYTFDTVQAATDYAQTVGFKLAVPSLIYSVNVHSCTRRIIEATLIAAY